MVESPETSSPGLAFLLGTIAHFGHDGWQDYWQRLQDNGVKVVSGWTDAYYVDFSGSAGKGAAAARRLLRVLAAGRGDRRHDHRPDRRPAGHLLPPDRVRGSAGGRGEPGGGAEGGGFPAVRRSSRPRSPRTMYVYPVDTGTRSPPTGRSSPRSRPTRSTLDRGTIADNREAWIEQWSDLMAAEPTMPTGTVAASADAPTADPLSPLEIRSRTRSPRGAPAGLVAMGLVPAAVLAVFFVYPVDVDRPRVRRAGRARPGGLRRRLRPPRFARIALFTVGQAAASAALATVLGVPVAYLLYRSAVSAGGRVLRALVTVPFVLPTVVVGARLPHACSPRRRRSAACGWTARSTPSWRHTCSSTIAVVVRTVGGAWERWTTGRRRPPRSLGAGGVRAFRTVTLPALGPSVGRAHSHGVPVLRDQFRHRPGARRLPLRDPGDRDLPADVDRSATCRPRRCSSVVQLALVVVVLVVAGRAAPPHRARRCGCAAAARAGAPAAPCATSGGGRDRSAGRAVAGRCRWRCCVVRSLQTADRLGPGQLPRSRPRPARTTCSLVPVRRRCQLAARPRSSPP